MADQLHDAQERWTKVATYGSGLEIDVARATLEAEGIPVQVRGQQVGIFGGAFQGPITGGADLLVPSSALQRARELLDDDT